MSETVPEGWKEERLGNLSEIFFSNVDKKSIEGEIPILLCNYMDVYSNRKIDTELEFMEATAKQREIDKFLLSKGDVMITKDSETPSDIAVPSYVSEKLLNVLCGYHLALIRPEGTNLSGEFLAHLFNLKSIQHRYYQLANGSTRFGLTAEVITDTPLPIPPLPEQKKIASILTSVDEVIETTQNQIDKLQDLKKATMNELLTKGIGHTEFKDSELGRIPKSWEVKKLHELTSGKFGIVDGPFGSNLKTEHYRTSGVPVIQSGFVTSGRFVAKNYVYVDHDKYLSEIRSAVRSGDIVMAKIGAQAGKCAIMPKKHPVGILAGNSLKISPDEGVLDINYLNNLLTYLYSTGEVQNLRTETAQPAISIATLKNYKIKVPSVLEQKKIAETIDAIDAGIERRFQKLSQTQSLKKSLMQDLLTGKVRVQVN
ncbi:restriction endonuclease subunit S [Paracoccaceae bacterium]|nr:restriction endonuclease subunit S [Paracoccaceae bacterium]